MAILTAEIIEDAAPSSSSSSDEGTISKESDHATRAVERLLAQYRQQPKLEALIALQAGYVQDLEDAAFDFFEQVTLAGAEGATLERLGLIVGQQREGRTDEVLRTWIGARIRLNRGSGTVPELVDLFSALAPEGATVVVRESFPAGLVVELEDVATPAELADQLARVLQLARGGGIRAFLISAVAPPEEAFAFAGVGVGMGFGTVADPLAGGRLAGARE